MFPWPLNLGARQRLFHLARGIAAGHEVSVVAYDAQPAAEDEAEFVSRSGVTDVQFVPRNEKRSRGVAGTPARGAAARILRKLVSIDERLRSPLPPFVRDAWSERLVAALETIRRDGSVDVDDLVSDLSRQHVRGSGWHRRKLIQVFDAAKIQRYERSLPTRFVRVVVAKNQDRDFFATSDRERVLVVPNGVTVPASPASDPAVADTLLFVGTLGYWPNIDAIRWFATEILPLIWRQMPTVRFVVAGYGSSSTVADVLEDPRCSVHESPPDLGPLYGEAAVVVTPVRIGGGTRIKILEALGRGRAVVSTPFGAEGLGLQGGVDLEYADTPTAFAERCIDLLRDPERRHGLASNGRRTVAAHFDWQSIERTLPSLFSDFAADAAPASSVGDDHLPRTASSRTR